MKQTELARYLTQWFEKQGEKQHGRLYDNKNPVCLVMKKNLVRLGYWKDLPRGNPEKGFQNMMRSMVEEVGECGTGS